ncbi:OLC1v1013316C1, partial [Oldenlandia corymbosa var. corymbosa]
MPKRPRTSPHPTKLASMEEPVTCTYCDRVGHSEKDCWFKQCKCLGCGSSEHFIRDCPKPRNNPLEQIGNVAPPRKTEDGNRQGKAHGRAYVVRGENELGQTVTLE